MQNTQAEYTLYRITQWIKITISIYM